MDLWAGILLGAIWTYVIASLDDRLRERAKTISLALAGAFILGYFVNGIAHEMFDGRYLDWPGSIVGVGYFIWKVWQTDPATSPDQSSRTRSH